MKRTYIIPAVNIITVAPALPLADSMNVNSEKVSGSDEIMSRGRRSWTDDDDD